MSFTKIDNSIIYNKGLRHYELGVYLYLKSHREDYKLSLRKIRQDLGNVDNRALNKILLTLLEKNLIADDWNLLDSKCSKITTKKTKQSVVNVLQENNTSVVNSLQKCSECTTEGVVNSLQKCSECTTDIYIYKTNKTNNKTNKTILSALPTKDDVDIETKKDEKNTQDEERFESVWKSYPAKPFTASKGNKQHAKKIWSRLNNKDKVVVEQSLQPYTDYLNHPLNQRLACQHLTTYLNKRSFETDRSIANTSKRSSEVEAKQRSFDHFSRLLAEIEGENK